MDRLDFDGRFNLLVQESFLAKHTLLSGVDGLLKANYYMDKDGYFYLGFFNISIGLERLMKLALLTDFMLENDYQTPSEKQLRGYGHDIVELFSSMAALCDKYGVKISSVESYEVDEDVLTFFSGFAKVSRYHNLNEMCERKFKVSPLYSWLRVLRGVYEESVSESKRERDAMRILYNMEERGQPNGYTANQDETGHPQTVFDCLHIQHIAKKAAPLIIWRIFELLRPVHLMLEQMAHKARAYESLVGTRNMVVPHFEDMFFFLLADKQSCLKRKRWLI